MILTSLPNKKSSNSLHKLLINIRLVVVSYDLR